MRQFIKASLAVAIAALPFCAQAQRLEVIAKDTALQKNVFFYKFPNGDKDKQGVAPLVFDKNGRAIWDEQMVAPWNEVRIFLGNGSEWTMFVEQGKTTRAEFTKDGDKTKVKFSGDNVKANEAATLQRESYMYPLFFFPADKPGGSSMTYDEKLALLDKNYAAVNKACEKVKNEGMRKQVSLDNRCEYLRFRLSIMRMKDKDANLDWTTDAEYQKYLDMIDYNNPYYEQYNLISNYISGKTPLAKLENGISEYGLAELEVINKYITDAKIRQTLQASVAQQVLVDNNPDVDKFWNVFKTKGDTTLVKALDYKVQSLKKTASGMKAPVFEFTDINGNVHSSAEYAGKLLYVDFWATWCGPCKAEIPFLAKLVEHYKGNDKVAFVSVSIDTNVKAWENKVTEDKPAWQQFIAKGKQSEDLSRAWGITAIPRFIIINPDGTIGSSDAFRPSDPDAIKKIDAMIKQ